MIFVPSGTVAQLAKATVTIRAAITEHEISVELFKLKTKVVSGLCRIEVQSVFRCGANLGELQFLFVT